MRDREREREGTRWYLQGARRPVQIDYESFVRAAKEIFVRIGRGLTNKEGRRRIRPLEGGREGGGLRNERQVALSRI